MMVRWKCGALGICFHSSKYLTTVPALTKAESNEKRMKMLVQQGNFTAPRAEGDPLLVEYA
jgi:hypothetical protein